MLTKNQHLNSPLSGGKEAMTMAGKKPITSGQADQIGALAAVAARRAFEQDDGSENAQHVIESGEDFQVAVTEALYKVSGPNRYATEEVKSDLGYSEGYAVKPVNTQIRILSDLFGDSAFHYCWSVVDEKVYPRGADGLFAIPRWEKIAPTYDKAVAKLMSMRIGATMFHASHMVGHLNLRQLRHTSEMMNCLSAQQDDHDIILVPAQFGKRHIGRSARRAQAKFFENEFGLGTYEACIMLFTHPERMPDWENDMEVNCIGDEYRNEAKGPYTFTPCISHDRDTSVLIFNVWPGRSNYRQDLAPITGFLPSL